MTSPTLSAQGKERLDALLTSASASGKWPALFFGATTADGEIYFNCKGDRVHTDPSKGQVDDKTTLQLYSMTKLITSIACIQLWERGLVDFDDAALIKKHLPELVTQPILKEYNDDTAVFTPRTRPLTLRHLLTHTSGLGSGMLSPLLGRWEAEHGGAKSFAPGATAADLAQPILFEPGTKYAYGIGLDWAGVLVERVSGSTLEDYFQTHIFAPIGLTKEDMTFLPTDSVQERLMEVLGRQPDGGLAPADGLRKVPGLTPQDVTLYLGGAGLLGTARAYMTVLREVLACGKRDGVLSRKGYDLVFANALPARSEQSSQQIYEDLAAMMVFSGLSEEQYTNPDGAGNAHSLALCLTELDSVHGRKKGTAWWSGAAKTRFWIDPVSGVAGFCGTQLVDLWKPFAGLTDEFERALYDGLQ